MTVGAGCTRFGLSDRDSWTLDVIATVHCITRERIRQIQKIVMIWSRSPSRRLPLGPYPYTANDLPSRQLEVNNDRTAEAGV